METERQVSVGELDTQEFKEANSKDVGEHLSRVKVEVLVALRSNRTQLQLSRMLGFSFNQVHRWESQSKKLKWDEFVQLCQVCRVDLGRAFKKCFDLQVDPLDLNILLRGLSRNKTPEQLAKELKVSVHMSRRWLNTSLYPEIEVVFKIIQMYTDALPEFLSQIVNIEYVPSLKGLYHMFAERRKFVAQNVYISEVLAALNLEEYQSCEKHSPQWIARRFDIPEEAITITLHQMEEAGIVKFNGQRYEFTCTDANERLDYTANPSAALQLAQYFTEKCAKRFTSPNPAKMGWFFYTVALSDKACAEVRDHLKECYDKIVDTIEGDAGAAKRKVRTILGHCFDPGEFHDPKIYEK